MSSISWHTCSNHQVCHAASVFSNIALILDITDLFILVVNHSMRYYRQSNLLCLLRTQRKMMLLLSAKELGDIVLRSIAAKLFNGRKLQEYLSTSSLN